MMTDTGLQSLFTLCETRLTRLFNFYLKQTVTPAPLLQEAMAYSVLNGGKRIRPALVYAAHTLFGAPLENCDAAACAIEFIHAYSLIHDDLPAMDNSDFRRGKPACHKKYNDAIAILAGDTLQPLAFEIIASHPAQLSSAQRIAMIKILATACGYQGMSAGQTLDILGVASLSELTKMYELKTGALLDASLQLGAIAANVQDEKILQILKQFTQHLGLAFQIQDDLLDIEGQEITGKPQGLDIANEKPTYPVLLGIEESKQKIKALFATALQALSPLGTRANILYELAHYLMWRKK